MDTNKLLEIINLIEADEKEYAFGSKIDEIYNLVSQNNEQAGPQIDEKIDLLEKDIKSSRAYRFVRTEVSLLEKLGLDNFFGTQLIESIQDIVNAKGYAILGKFKQFKSNRTEKYTNILRLRDSLISVGVVPYQQTQDEVALTIPEEISVMDEIADYLKKMGIFIDAVQRCLSVQDKESKHPRLTRISNGSFNFFTIADPEVVETILGILSDLATIYLVTKELRSKKADPELDDAEQQELNKFYEKIAKNRFDKFLDDTVESVGKTNDGDQKSRLRTSLKALVKWLPLGIHLEVVFKKSIDPVDPQGDVNALDLIADKVAQKLKIEEMYKLPAEQLKLPESSESEKATDKEGRNTLKKSDPTN
ncbi:MAG: hypothetical protein WC519_01985 [Parcubacteria group bacterium]